MENEYIKDLRQEFLKFLAAYYNTKTYFGKIQ